MENKDFYTFNEIMEFTGWGHTTVARKIKVLEIKPAFTKPAKKNGIYKYYSREDVEKINAYRPAGDQQKPANRVFYRVSVWDGIHYIVKAVGLTEKKAKTLVKKYQNDGYAAKAIACI